MKIHFLVFALFAVATFTAYADSDEEHGYRLVILADAPGNRSFMNGDAINDAGQVLGGAWGPCNCDYRQYIWDGNTVIDLTARLESLPGGDRFPAAFTINNAGDLAGSLSNPFHAALWRDGSTYDLGPGASGGERSLGLAMNNAGQVVGYAYLPGEVGAHATVWTNGAAIDLGPAGERDSGAEAISDNGLVVGESSVAGTDSFHAILWRHGAAIDLGTLGGANSSALDVNNAGLVVGRSEFDGSGISHAVLWRRGSAFDLGTLDGSASDSAALAINNSGTVVGYSRIADNTRSHAVLWRNRNIVDLNVYLDGAQAAAGWVLDAALDINNHGWILGALSNPAQGLYNKAFILIPGKKQRARADRED